LLSFDETSLESYFKELHDLPLLSPEEEKEVSSSLDELKTDALFLLSQDDLLRRMLFMPRELGGVFSGHDTIEDIFEISQAEESREYKVTKVRRSLYRLLKIEPGNGVRALSKLPFRWEVVESLLQKYCSYGPRPQLAQLLYNKILETRDKFITSNLRLVIEMIKRLGINPNGAIPWEDLIQEGNIGLMKAVSKYDPSRGFRFSTYACWWITQSVIRAIADKGRLIRLPVHTQSKELRDSNKMPVQILMPLDRPVYSDEDGEMCLADVLPQKSNQDDITCLAEINETLLNCLTRFSPREEKIIRMYYGLDGKLYTLEQIGVIFGVTRERIRQIRDRLLQLMRSNEDLDNLKTDISDDLDPLESMFTYIPE